MSNVVNGILRKQFAFLCCCFSLFNVFAQSPNAIPYQAVVRNAAGLVVANQPVKMRFSIRDSIAAGTVLYREQHAVTTNGQGLVSLNIGTGSVLSGTFAGINWGRNAKFLQAELDAQNTNNFIDLGTAQMMSVPYALHASNGQSSGLINGEMQYWNGSSWIRLTPGNYGQSLVICDGFPQWGGCLPKVTTGSISGISQVEASAGANVTSDGGAAVTARGLCWSTGNNPTVSGPRTTNGSGTGSFSGALTGLTASTTYFVRAYATNSVGTAYGNEQSFNTIAIALATLTTNAVSSLTLNTAVCGGNITNTEGSNVTMRGVCWSTSPNPTVALSTKTQDGPGSGSFTSSITGLQGNTTYYVRAYATNGAGTAYGNEVSFITATLPSISTATISIGQGAALCGGSIISDGGTPVSERGICWSTTPAPTITLATKTSDGSGIGSFSSLMSSLTPGLTYYVRAYATNGLGTSYGNQLSFSTLPGMAHSCGTSNIHNSSLNYGSMTDQDGNTYKTIQIGSQIWMAENLKVRRYRNGDVIPLVTADSSWPNLTSGAACWYNNDSAANNCPHGKLYNWYAVVDTRNLCPAGWHVPSSNEFTQLIDFLGGDTLSGGRMKSTSLLWASPNKDANNTSGWSGLPGGWRFSPGGPGVSANFVGMGSFSFWWSSTGNPLYDSASLCGLVSQNTSNYYVLIQSDSYRADGNSVRCVKD